MDLLHYKVYYYFDIILILLHLPLSLYRNLFPLRTRLRTVIFALCKFLDLSLVSTDLTCHQPPFYRSLLLSLPFSIVRNFPAI